MRIIVGLPNFGSASPFLLAERLGYYAEEGLKVTVSQSESVTAAVASGQADVGTSDLGQLNDAVKNGLKFQAFSGFRCNNQVRFAVGPGISSVSDLAGKDVVLATAAGDPEIDLRKSILAKAGWDLDTVKVNQVFVPGGSTAWAKLLANGKISLTPFYSSSKKIIDDAGGKVIVDELIHTPNDVMFANSAWLKDNPNTAIRFLRATLRGTAYNIDLANEESVLKAAEALGYDTAASRYDYKAGVNVFCANMYLEESSFDQGLAQAGVTEHLGFADLTDITALNKAQELLGLDNKPQT